ncbi:hypothetical protein BG004_002346 [Podila humilis]|nr:hypothetical protein BG004_002346 [Podila humilis]
MSESQALGQSDTTMESKISWILKQTIFDIEAFATEFNHETEKSLLNDVQELMKNTRISQAARKAMERSLENWQALDRGMFWHEQSRTVTAKKALSNAQTTIISTADSLIPGTLTLVANAIRREGAHVSNSLPRPTVTLQAPLLQPTSLLQPTFEEGQISTTPVGSPTLSPLRTVGPRPHKTKDNTLVLEDLSTDISASDSPDAAPSARSLTPESTNVEPTSDEPSAISNESEELLEREREDLLQNVDESDHPSCEWKIDGSCAACRFVDYRRACIHALIIHKIKKTDVADIMAIIGVFAPHMPTSRMQEFFSAEQLQAISGPGLELPDINVDDEKVMKAVRLYLKRKGDEAEIPLVGGNKKMRIMLETLPNTSSTTQTQQNMKADRPDIRAMAMDQEIMWGEVTGPIQSRCSAKNLWDTYKLARYGKAFIIAGNDSAPLIQVIDDQGSYMRLYLKTRGMMILEEVGTFVIPTRKEMVPALVATLPTLELLKEHVKKLSDGRKVHQLKRSWGQRDERISKKRLL